MAALTASQILRTRARLLMNAEIKNAETLYYGGLAALGQKTLGTASERGRASAYTGAAGEIPAGLILPGGDQTPTGGTMDRDGVLGDITPPTGEDIPSASIDIGGTIIENVTVTGASAVTDTVGQFVYCSTDNVSDLTLTRPTRGVPLGFIVNYRTGTSCDVYLFSLAEIMLAGLAGNGQYTWHLGVVVAEASDAANLLTGIECPHAGLITDFYAICASAPADADMAMDINLEIDGTNVNGGVVELRTADTLGLKKSGTAITADNAFSEGSLIDVEAASVTAGTVGDGIYNLYAEVQPLPGS